METDSHNESESIRILRLFKEGKLTENQAFELLNIASGQNDEEVTYKGANDSKVNSPDTEPKTGGELSFDLNADNIGSIVKSIWKGSFSFSKTSNGNDINMSQFADPTGSEFEFSNNHFSVSSATELNLEFAKMTDNSIQASRIADFRLDHSKFCSNEVHGASLSHVQINQSEMSDNEFHGSKLSKLSLDQKAKCVNSEFHGATVKGFTLHNDSIIKDCVFHGCALSMITFVQTEMKDCKLQGVQYSDTSFDKCNLADTVFKDVQIRKSKFVECEFKNAVFQRIDLEGKHYKGLKATDAKFKSTRDFLDFARPFEIND